MLHAAIALHQCTHQLAEHTLGHYVTLCVLPANLPHHASSQPCLECCWVNRASMLPAASQADGRCWSKLVQGARCGSLIPKDSPTESAESLCRNNAVRCVRESSHCTGCCMVCCGPTMVHVWPAVPPESAAALCCHVLLARPAPMLPYLLQRRDSGTHWPAVALRPAGWRSCNRSGLQSCTTCGHSDSETPSACCCWRAAALASPLTIPALLLVLTQRRLLAAAVAPAHSCFLCCRLAETRC